MISQKMLTAYPENEKSEIQLLRSGNLVLQGLKEAWICLYIYQSN